MGPITNAGKYCGLYYEVNNAGERVTLIGVALANADALGNGSTDKVEAGLIGEYYPVIRTTQARSYLGRVTFEMNPKAGYWFALCRANKAGYTYNIVVAKNKYGMIAGPDDYGSTGQSMFCVNEEGTVYGIDLGKVGYIDFPGNNPIDNGWSIAQ